VEKYRPSTLDDLVSHQDIVSTSTGAHPPTYVQAHTHSRTHPQPVSRFIDEKKLPHLLFYGPPGTGKTSTILACARRMYGANVPSMVLEVRGTHTHTHSDNHTVTHTHTHTHTHTVAYSLIRTHSLSRFSHPVSHRPLCLS
jgi:replication-associated recombination protein RarA